MKIPTSSPRQSFTADDFPFSRKKYRQTKSLSDQPIGKNQGETHRLLQLSARQDSQKQNDKHLEDKKMAAIERNEIKASFGILKRVYQVNNIQAKLDETADTWIGACFFAKNVIKFRGGLLRLIFEKLEPKSLIGCFSNNKGNLMVDISNHRQRVM